MVGFLLMEASTTITPAVAEQEEIRPSLQLSWLPSSLSRKNGVPLGFKNLGNTCYLNSVLQCLTFTPPLANFCLAFRHSAFCNSVADPNQKRDCPFCLLEKRIVRSHSIELTQDAPLGIIKCLKIFSENFKSGRQEDAHEFLRYVIDACHNTCLRLKKQQQHLSKKTSNGTGGESLSSNSIVKDIFGGALQSQVKCLPCGNESNKVDEIMDICLEISGCSSLKEAMRKFFQAEILDGNNKYKCERCKKLVTAKKQMSLHQAPNVLVVQLKRFEGIFGGKIDRLIAFEEILVLSSFMCKGSQDTNPEYSLFATIVHSGFSPESGHYYAYIKDALGRWYCCNDSYVTSSTLQEVLSEKAYILFFTRKSQRPVSADIASVSNGLKSHVVATVSNGTKTHAIATVSSGTKTHAIGAVANGVKSHISNGHAICRSPKGTTPVNSVCIKSSNASSSGKVVPVSSKANAARASAALQNKSSELANSLAKKDSPSGNGTVDIQKKESLECNGNISHVASKHMNGNGVGSLAHDNGNHINGKQKAIEDTQNLVNGNGPIQNGHDVFEKEVREKGNSSKDEDVMGKVSFNGTIDNGLKNGRESVSGSKRKLENTSSCILLPNDTQSGTQDDHFKEELQRKTYLALQSSGWTDKLYNFMKSRKRLCMDTRTSTDTSEQKRLLIADAKPTFIPQIPGSVKEMLIKHIRSGYSTL